MQFRILPVDFVYLFSVVSLFRWVLCHPPVVNQVEEDNLIASLNQSLWVNSWVSRVCRKISRGLFARA